MYNSVSYREKKKEKEITIYMEIERGVGVWTQGEDGERNMEKGYWSRESTLVLHIFPKTTT